MLFDLRGRGRRRTVQGVFLGMALLFMLGFLGLGVGVGGGGGGILNFFAENKGSSGASFAGKVAAAQKRTKSHPTEAAAWAALAEAQLHQASEPEFITVVGEREGPSAKGLALLAQVSSSWNTYLRLKPPHPNPALGQQMATLVYDELDLNQPAEAMRALKIAVAGKSPSAELYSALAELAYKARHIKEGDAATRKALALIPVSAERTRVKKLLAELRKNPLSHVPTVVSKLSNGTYVATQAGKTFPVAKAPNGSFTGVVTTPAPATTPAGHASTATTPASTTTSAGHTTSSKK
jgi:hypothetical protein